MAGGGATAAGTGSRAQVGAGFAAQLLAEEPLGRRFGLGAARPKVRSSSSDDDVELDRVDARGAELRQEQVLEGLVVFPAIGLEVSLVR